MADEQFAELTPWSKNLFNMLMECTWRKELTIKKIFIFLILMIDAIILLNAKCKVIIKDDVLIEVRNGVLQQKSSIKSISIPNGVRFINNSAFEDCINLRTLEIPDTVQAIGKFAFRNCDSLKNIEIPDSVLYIRYGAFLDCNNLVSVKLPDSLNQIDSSVFSNCKRLKDIKNCQLERFDFVKGNNLGVLNLL